jgi:hypothetical protein
MRGEQPNEVKVSLSPVGYILCLLVSGAVVWNFLPVGPEWAVATAIVALVLGRGLTLFTVEVWNSHFRYLMLRRRWSER